MIQIIPNDVTKIRERLQAEVYSIASDENLRLLFIIDSKSISKALDEIAFRLYAIKAQCKPEIPTKDFKKFQKLVKKK